MRRWVQYDTLQVIQWTAAEMKIHTSCRCDGNDFQKLVCPILTAAEGFVLGVGAKMFTIAGPVIVYGVSASVVYGLIYWITTLF